MRGVSSSNVDKLKNIYNGSTINAYLIFHILHNPVSCGADGLLGDAHDTADVLIFQAHFIENEEESVVGGLGSVFLLDAAESGEVDGLVVVDEAFVVVVRPTLGGAVFFDFIV